MVQRTIPGCEHLRVYDTHQVARASGLSARQLQYLDQTGALIVTKQRRCDGAMQRCFTLAEALVCVIIWELRDLQLKRREVRAILPAVRNNCRELVAKERPQHGIPVYLITDGARVIASSENKTAQTCSELRRRVLTINLSDKLSTLLNSIN